MPLLEQQDDFGARHPESITITPASRTPRIIQIPNNFFPHSDFEDAVWVVMTPRRLQNITTGGRGGRYHLGKAGTVMKFLAPQSIVDVHNHDWQEYESFHSKLLEKIRATHTGVDQFTEISEKVAKELSSAKWSDVNTLKKIQAKMESATSSTVPQYKIDTPLVFQSSSRREMTLEFQLASAEGGADIMEAIRLLQQYSAAQASQENSYGIQFPYIWEIRSDPPGLIFFKRAAITSIQPEYKTPYVGGNACIIDLSLSFKDLDPLFSSFIEDTDNIISVTENKSQTQIDKSRHGKIDEEMLRRAREAAQGE